MRRYKLELYYERWQRQAVRITAALIRQRFRNDPDFFKPYPPDAILALRREVILFFPVLGPWFHYIARNMAHGMTLAEVTAADVENTVRAVAKRRAVPRR